MQRRYRFKRIILLLGALLLLVLLASVVVLLHRHYYFDRLYHGWWQLSGQTTPADALELRDYRVAIDGKPVPGIDRNLSGLAFDPDRELLWAVTNGPNELLSLTKAGEVMHRYVLDGFEDVEGVAYFGNGRLVLAEERRQRVVVVSIPEQREGTIGYAQLPGLTLALGATDNKGFEGLTYDIASDVLFIAQEREPRRVYRIDGLRRALAGDLQLAIRDITPALESELFARDLSSLVFNPASDHLLLLSDESKLLIEFDTQGKLIGYLSLGAGFAGLAAGIPQAEGVTLDAQQTLYIISEPNLFYRFERSDPAPP